MPAGLVARVRAMGLSINSHLDWCDLVEMIHELTTLNAERNNFLRKAERRQRGDETHRDLNRPNVWFIQWFETKKYGRGEQVQVEVEAGADGQEHQRGGGKDHRRGVFEFRGWGPTPSKKLPTPQQGLHDNPRLSLAAGGRLVHRQAALSFAAGGRLVQSRRGTGRRASLGLHLIWLIDDYHVLFFLVSCVLRLASSVLSCLVLCQVSRALCVTWRIVSFWFGCFVHFEWLIWVHLIWFGFGLIGWLIDWSIWWTDFDLFLVDMIDLIDWFIELMSFDWFDWWIDRLLVDAFERFGRCLD